MMSIFQLRNLTISWRLALILFVSLGIVLGLAALMLMNNYRNLHEAKVLQLRSVVETAWGTIAEVHALERSGQLDRKQAQARAAATVSALGFAGEYFFINDVRGPTVAHRNPDLLGKDTSGLKDPSGVYFVQEMSRVAQEKGEGVVLYQWPKQTGAKPVDKMTYVKLYEPWGWVLATGLYIDDIKAQFRQELLQLASLCVFLLGLLAAAILLIARSITQPMRDTVAAMADIASGEGDLTRQLSAEGKDELSNLARHFNTFTGKLREVIGETKKTALTLSGTARNLDEQAGEARARSERQSQQVEQVATAINEVAYSVQDVAKNAEHTATEVRSAEERAEDGLRGIDTALAQVEQLSVTVAEAVRVVSGLAEESNRIGSVLEVIQAVAEQTNLLALNAAIEAARAGEQGRGFAVVADEVRLLAQRTQKSTAEIRSMIEEFRTHSSAAVKAIDESSRVTRLTIEQAAEAGASLRQIVESLRSITALAASIASATLQQSHVVDEINGNVAQTADLAQENARNAEQAAAAGHTLSKAASGLDTLLGRFQV